MAADVGRNLTVTRGAVLLAAVRTKSVAINREPIDITNDDSDGWRTMLEEPGERSVNISVSGISDDGVLRDAVLGASNVLQDITLTWPDGATLNGDFFLASYTENGTYNDAITFDAELQSSGQPTYSPASP
jgi:TP901-1 family phage major tail protein